MNAAALLRDRYAGINARLHDLVEQLSDVDWGLPVASGTSPIGLTLWHLPRTQDWALNTCVRNAPEVADTADHAGLPDPDTFGFGAGLTEAQAGAAAAQVAPNALLRYADAVHSALDAWLDSLREDDLDRPVIDFDERQRRRPGYSTPGALAEVAGLRDATVGAMLLRPAMSHLLWHMGEVETLGQLAARGRR